MKKLVAFDLDGTLAPSKSPLPDRIAGLMRELLEKYEVCVISGGKFGQFEKQLLGNLEVSDKLLQKLHIMPTCGTKYYLYNASTKKWNLQYSEDFTDEQKEKIKKALNKGFDDLGYREKKVYGETLEDRGSQITFSVLGQDIVDVLGLKGVEMKENWDPDNIKKQKVRDYIAPLIPEFEVRVGGVTSIDVTKKGIDKAYGMKKLMEALGLQEKDIIFIGDRLQEGGNDFPVKAMGIDSVEVKSWEETAVAIRTICYM